MDLGKDDNNVTIHEKLDTLLENVGTTQYEYDEGSASYSCGGYSSTGGTITFNKPFSSIPKVGIQVNGQPFKRMSIGSITTTSFSISIPSDIGSTVTFTVNWIAIAKK